MKHNNLSTLAAGCLLILAVLLAGCATPLPPPEANPFFEEWKEKAENSRPVLKSQRREEPTILTPSATGAPGTLPLAQREELLLAELPNKPISIRLVDVEIATAMRSLARAVGQNIMVNPSVQGKVNIHAEEMPWNEVFMGLIRSYGLLAAKEGNLLRVMSVEDMKRQVERQALELESEQVSPLLTAIIPIKYADPALLAESLKLLLTMNKEGAPRGSVSVDKHTRSLVVRDAAANLDRLIEFIQGLDQATPQILIEAHIIETNQDTARELGVQWGWFWQNQLTAKRSIGLTPGGISGTVDADTGVTTYNAGVSGANRTGISTQGFGIDLPAQAIGNLNPASIGFIHASLSGNILEMQLSALQKAGKINILSRPSIVTLDNNEAVIESGAEVPFQTVENQEVKVEYKDATLKLTVTPSVISGELVKLKIEAKKDEVDLTRTVLGNPFIIKKLAQTNLIVDNGATVVIAGLSKERNADSKTGVPHLQDVPLLGHLFQHDSRSGEFEELLIFITPRIMMEARPTPAEAKGAGANAANP